jgi:hypothetical protein
MNGYFMEKLGMESNHQSPQHVIFATWEQIVTEERGHYFLGIPRTCTVELHWINWAPVISGYAEKIPIIGFFF